MTLINCVFWEHLQSMDSIHGHEVLLINQLYDMIKEGNKEKITLQLEELIADVEHHFETENVDMKATAYPNYAIHKKVHDLALKKLYDVQEKWTESLDVSILKTYLEKRLKPWLETHLKTMDKVTAEYLVAHGCK